jgi:hypothetical protein
MDRLVYVVSDLHLGPGRLPDGRWDPLEDFIYGDQLARFLDSIGRGGEPVELVIAGDFLEYTQTLPEIGLASPADHLGSSEEESIRRTRVILGQSPEIASGHPEVFAALRRFMMEGNSITIIAGNHDIDLLWEGVWALIFDTIYPPGSVGDLRLLEYSHTIGSAASGRVYIEHGHEHDPANRFGDQMRAPFDTDSRGVRRLKRCWGTLFVDKVYNQLEVERWFIDNVKPIPRVVKLGLANDFRFTATALGLIARFLLTSGLPPLLGGSDEVLGAAPEAAPTVEEIVGAVADPALRAALEAELANPAARAEIAGALLGMGSSEWSMVQSGAAPPLTLDSVDVVTGGEVVLGGGAGADDAFRSAARAALEADPTVETVIMGHTHGPIDGFMSPLDLFDGRRGYYFNSGTWTRHLKDPGRSYSWQEISDERSYSSSFSYIRLDPQPDGSYLPSLGSWAAH